MEEEKRRKSREKEGKLLIVCGAYNKLESMENVWLDDDMERAAMLCCAFPLSQFVI